jgi:hypothetical protein
VTPDEVGVGAFDAPQATTPESTAAADANQILLHNLLTLLRLPSGDSLRLFFPEHNV